MNPIELKSVLNTKIKPMPLPNDLWKWLDNIPLKEQWSIGIYGVTGGGKSSFLLYLAAVLSKHGKLLYANFEENVQGGTIQNKARTMGYNKNMRWNWALKNIVFLNSTSIDYLKDALATGKYKFCIIDSVSSILAEYKVKLHDILALKEQYPEVDFIFVLHATKDGKYSGRSTLPHLFDIFIEMQKGGIAIMKKNRYATQKTLGNPEFKTFDHKVQ